MVDVQGESGMAKGGCILGAKREADMHRLPGVLHAAWELHACLRTSFNVRSFVRHFCNTIKDSAKHAARQIVCALADRSACFAASNRLAIGF